jgi:hypothetical protein
VGGLVEKIIENNKVKVSGTVISPLKFSHEMYGEGFYNFNLEVPRLSDISDVLPVTISERILIGLNFSVGINVTVEGQLRSYNKVVGESSKLILTVFARNIAPSESEDMKNPNQIYLDGYLCKSPIYRTTPFGREISDLLLAVNRPYNKSDYVPVIAWGRNAKYSQDFIIGDRIRLWGRIQSREYQKKISEEEVITRIAYEVSISKLQKVDKDSEEIEDLEEQFI